MLGDSFNPRKVLTLAYAELSIFFLLQGLAGMFNITNQAYFYFVSIGIGAGNAVLPPTFIGILGNWFAKKNRGFLVGFWMSCNNFGNIVGIQIAAGLMTIFGDHWENLLLCIAVLVGLSAFVIFFFLVPDPQDVNIIIEEYTEKEAIVDSVIIEEKIRSIVPTASA